ncbi:MAG: hypothetical protein M0Z66_00620 [Thermaerobacter sp.]|nr:hypothetical protein [Thermaerobacter sp.]
MRAIVLERRGSYAIVLMPGGRFARMRAPYAAVGEEIETSSRQALVPSTRLRPYGYAAAALAVVLALLPAALPHASAQVAAYATLDVNPSVQFGLSEAGSVVTAQGLDKDGMRVLAQARPVGLPLATAVSKILAAAAADGLLTQGGDASVILATYPAGNAAQVPTAVQQQVLAARATGKAFLTARHARGIVSAMIVPSWLRTAARRAKVSPGIYAVAVALRSAGVKVNVHSLQGRKLGSAIERIAATPAGQSVLSVFSGSAAVQAPEKPAVTPVQPVKSPVLVLSPDGSDPILGGSDAKPGQGKSSQPGKGEGQGHAKGTGKGNGNGVGIGKGPGLGKGEGSGNGNGNGNGNGSGKGKRTDGGSSQGSGRGSNTAGHGSDGSSGKGDGGTGGVIQPLPGSGGGSSHGSGGTLLPQGGWGSLFPSGGSGGFQWPSGGDGGSGSSQGTSLLPSGGDGSGSGDGGGN